VGQGRVVEDPESTPSPDPVSKAGMPSREANGTIDRKTFQPSTNRQARDGSRSALLHASYASQLSGIGGNRPSGARRPRLTTSTCRRQCLLLPPSTHGPGYPAPTRVEAIDDTSRQGFELYVNLHRDVPICVAAAGRRTFPQSRLLPSQPSESDLRGSGREPRGRTGAACRCNACSAVQSPGQPIC
jgi:hypothetical protein